MNNVRIYILRHADLLEEEFTSTPLLLTKYFILRNQLSNAVNFYSNLSRMFDS